jgi:hypothetical protein
MRWVTERLLAVVISPPRSYNRGRSSASTAEPRRSSDLITEHPVTWERDDRRRLPWLSPAEPDKRFEFMKVALCFRYRRVTRLAATLGNLEETTTGTIRSAADCERPY